MTPTHFVSDPPGAVVTVDYRAARGMKSLTCTTPCALVLRPWPTMQITAELPGYRLYWRTQPRWVGDFTVHLEPDPVRFVFRPVEGKTAP